MSLIWKTTDWNRFIEYENDLDLLPKNTSYFTQKKLTNEELQKIKEVQLSQLDLILSIYIK